MNEKLIQILLEKIDYLEKRVKNGLEYISALETENANLKQLNRELKENK